MNASLRTRLDSLSKRLEELNRLLSAEDATRDMGGFKKLSREQWQAVISRSGGKGRLSDTADVHQL